MKVLFVMSPNEDYLADSLLIGMRNLLKDQCVDFPKAEVLYKGHDLTSKYRIYGNGFTLYNGLLENIHVDRFRISERLANGDFDLIIISNIWNLYGYFVQLRPWLTSKNTIIIDGADTSKPYPAAGLWWRKPYYWFLPRAHRKYLYFKRELTAETRFGILTRMLPQSIIARLPQAYNLRPIAFSIPDEKIMDTIPLKTKDFPRHIVDPEVAGLVPGAATSYAFSSEEEYYKDLQSSRFGITMKRSGWDCMRHYEIAANAAVPCFRNLNRKPENCAPHGLNESNSICYQSAEDLFHKVESLSEHDYLALQQGARAWALKNTTSKAAEYVLAQHHTFASVK